MTATVQPLPHTNLHVMTKGVGPTLLLIHGFLGSTFSWRHVIEPLAQAGFTVLAVDLPGFGATPGPWETDHAHTAFADECARLLKAMGGGAVHVMGHSMGGKVALWLALRHPELVRALTLVDPAVLTGVVPGVVRTRLVSALLRWVLGQRWSKRDRFQRDLDRFYGRPVEPEVVEDYWRRYAQRELQAGALAHLRDSNGDAIDPHLGRVGVDLHLIWGDADRVVPPSHAQQLSALLTGVPGGPRITLLPGVDHFPPESAPAAFLEAALPFLLDRRG